MRSQYVTIVSIPDMDDPSNLMPFVQLVMKVSVHGAFLLAFLIVSFSRPL